MESPIDKEINVLRLSNFQQFTFRSFLAVSSSDGEPITNPGQGQAQLRKVCLDFIKCGILSSIHGGQLWVFSSDRKPDDEFNLRETSIGTLISSSLLIQPEETTSQIRPPLYVLAFLAAIRNLISYKFTSEMGYMLCGSYLLPPLPLQKHNEFLHYVDPNPPIASPLVSISFQHTPKGILLTSVKRLKYRLIRMTEAKFEIEVRTLVILAPSGFVGYFIGSVKPPTRGLERLTTCLLYKGLKLEEFEDWIQIELKHTLGDYVIWPAQLCFFRERLPTLDKGPGIESWNYVDAISTLSRDIALVEKKQELDEDVNFDAKDSMVYPTPPHVSSVKRTPKNVTPQNINQPFLAEGRQPSPVDLWQPDGLDADFDIGQVQITDADFDFFDEKPSESPSIPDKFNRHPQKTPDSRTSPVIDQKSSMSLDSSPLSTQNHQKTPLNPSKTFVRIEDSSSPLVVHSKSNTPSRSTIPADFKAKAIHPRVNITNKKYSFGGRFWCPPKSCFSSSDDDEEVEPSVKVRPLPHGEKRKYEGEPEKRNQRYMPEASSFSVSDDLLYDWNSILLEELDLEEHLSGSTKLEGTEFDHIATTLCEQVLYWEEMQFQGFEESTPEFNLIKKLLSSIFQEMPQKLKLGEFAETTDSLESTGSNSGRILPKTARPYKSEDLVFMIDPPDVFVARNDQYFALNPCALRLWHQNGFTPLAGPKNIVSLVLYPDSEALACAVDTFLNEQAEVYEQLGLGVHSRGVLEECTTIHGMCPIPLNAKQLDLNSGLSSFHDACNKIGRLNSVFKSNLQNLVIYMVNPFPYPEGLLSLCQCFLRLKNMYLSSLGESGSSSGNTVILQILPVKFMIDNFGVPFRSLDDLKKLAFEIYDKASSTDEALSEILSYSNSRINTPAFMLKKPVPRTIPYQLLSHGPSFLLQEGSTLHIGYATSANHRWICVVWCDEYGEFAYKRAFCLARPNTRPREFRDICREIWESTIEILRTKKIKWKVVLSKVGVLGTTELLGWLQLIRSSEETNFSVIILNVDTQPSIQLDETLGFKSAPISSTSLHDGFNGDMKVINTDDIVWGVLTNHRMRIGLAGVDYDGGDNFFRFSLGTGFLVKRIKGDKPRVLQVNLLHNIEKPVQTKLKDILVQFRNMATFGIIKGISAKTECIPWHLSAADQMQNILSLLM